METTLAVSRSVGCCGTNFDVKSYRSLANRTSVGNPRIAIANKTRRVCHSKGRTGRARTGLAIERLKRECIKKRRKRKGKRQMKEGRGRGREATLSSETKTMAFLAESNREPGTRSISICLDSLSSDVFPFFLRFSLLRFPCSVSSLFPVQCRRFFSVH